MAGRHIRDLANAMRYRTAIVTSDAVQSFAIMPESVSPDPGHAIAVEDRLVAHNRNVLQLRLGDEHTIERIAVPARQAAGPLSVEDRDIERGEPLTGYRTRDILGDRQRARKLADARLGRDLPR